MANEPAPNCDLSTVVARDIRDGDPDVAPPTCRIPVRARSVVRPNATRSNGASPTSSPAPDAPAKRRAGAVEPAFGLLDAVSKGVLDGGHGVLVYHYGKNTALALWGSGPGYAMDANMLLAWHKYGGGKALLEKIFATIGADVVSFPYAPLYSQPLGWFKKPMQTVDDFKGLKYRTVGISIDLFTEMGAAVNALPGGEIGAAIDRGLLDAAEFNNASSDRALGFADVSKICMLQSYHQNAEQLEITFNKTKFDALPDKFKAIISNAVEAASQDM